MQEEFDTMVCRPHKVAGEENVEEIHQNNQKSLWIGEIMVGIIPMQ
jgi:hypothetical protein